LLQDFRLALRLLKESFGRIVAPGLKDSAVKGTSMLVGVSVGFLLVGMAVMLVFQERGLIRMQQVNGLLRRQVDEFVAQADQLSAEKTRLATLVAADQRNAGMSPSQELLRLRGEVGRLRLQDIELEQSRRDQSHAARSKLTNAEAELARLTKAHSEGLVSDAELSQARLRVELLKAEARGDAVGAAQVRLQQAEENAAQAAELRSQSLIGEPEYEKALQRLKEMQLGGR
jgi:hypothetical protein